MLIVSAQWLCWLFANSGDVDPSNGHIDPSWILATKNGEYDKITLFF